MWCDDDPDQGPLHTTFKLDAEGEDDGEDRRQTLDFQMQAGKLLGAVAGADGKLEEALEQLEGIETAILQASRADLSLLDEARQLELKLLDLRDTLTGDSTRTRRRQTTAPSILERARNALSGSLDSTYGPTKTHRQELAIAQQQFQSLAAKITQMLEVDLVALQKRLDQAGVPWTSGRPVPKLNQ